MKWRQRAGYALDPLWYKDAIIYQLHIKSFYDANDDGIGDIRGLIAKLDYIVELGADTIWLLPFYPSPRRDDGYDISDYRGIHQDYGTIADLQRFIRAAHERNLRVITELVINHTSDQHAWFQRARTAKKNSVYRNYYVWSDTDQAYAGTRIIFIDTEKSNWTWDPVAGAYFWHRFYSHQPDLNFDNPRVLKDVLSVMRFWLDLGVDGLRLDAVPYLVEREGTNNENLPETHAVLKRIRAELDSRYPARMLLAEANQWPEDAQQYFGEGDECHMAFHFPLMPRIYMAIAQEDRFPISDILRQTPQIPDNCQWAVFLRNHDELTLEMVTDQERDYLWDTYAADRRARLNLGIRRRLGPLVEHDRRRVELMNGLLLSMPGTPVIYYGDEIGMGDNIHLGDRDGVRTPMQWSPDRNGGFSRANPAQLVLPPIMDPLYGFQAVNVEAQSSDPHSLLNWTRRMLAVRRQQRAFGRGDFQLLAPGNRKVLAYLRCFEGTTILCVNNLSRTAQAVELDLSQSVERIPVDIVGGASFPPIGQLPYLLTLPPYGFYWFSLAVEADLPRWHRPAPEPLPDFVTVVLRQTMSEMLAAPLRGTLERELLPTYLNKRRWFGEKSQGKPTTTLDYGTLIADKQHPLMLAEVKVHLNDHFESYQLPLGILWEDEIQTALPQQLALARVRKGRRLGILTDAMSIDAFPISLISHLQTETRIPCDDGEIVFSKTPLLDAVEFTAAPTIRHISAEQSNSAIIVDDAVLIKLLRRINPGIHPEAEFSRHLAERGFHNTSPFLGEIVRILGDGTSHTLAVIQGFIRNQGDGWSWTSDFLARWLEDAAVAESPGEEGMADELLAPYNILAAAIGRRLGELHACLAEASSNPDFSPEPVRPEDMKTWRDQAADMVRRAFATLDTMSSTDPLLAAQIDRLLHRRREIDGFIRNVTDPGGAGLKTRIHGDFHLGQVLVVQNDAFIIDFEGEPAQPLQRRRAKANPLRDVAGLLRSLDYAASVASAGGPPTTSHIDDRRHTLLGLFRTRAVEAFLQAYQEALSAASAQWSEGSVTDPLLTMFLIEKAAYEIFYEATNRPTWLAIPVGGLGSILDSISMTSPEHQNA